MLETLAGWPWDSIREWLTLGIASIGGGAAVFAALKGAASAKAAAEAAMASTRQAILAESLARPLLKVWEEDSVDGSIMVHNVGAGRAIAVRAHLALRLLPDSSKTPRAADYSRNSEAELKPLLLPGHAMRILVLRITSTPHFVGTEYRSVRVGTGIYDEESGQYPLSLTLQLDELQPPARFAVDLTLSCSSVLGERVEAESLSWERELRWSTSPSHVE